MTRRGAGQLAGGTSASEEWRRAIDRARSPETDESRTHDWEPEVWVEVDPELDADDNTADASATAHVTRRTPRTGSRFTGIAVPTSAASPVKRSRRMPLPEPVIEELVDAGGSRKAPSLEKRLGDAVRAYEADRYRDALKVLKPLAELTPDASSVRELHGLTLYRMGRWKAALAELEAYHRLTASYDQYPVMADCERALRHPTRVASLWDDLRQSSPSAEVLTEGRIVMAGSLADQNDVAGAIALLEHGGVARARPQEHHLRVWYALADLYERAGDVPRARELFRRILSHRPDFHDVTERLAGL